MEDALVQKKSGRRSKSLKCLNPCFNGRCTRTRKSVIKMVYDQVLILVLMEDALVLQ